MHKVGGSESWIADRDNSSVVNDILSSVGKKKDNKSECVNTLIGHGCTKMEVKFIRNPFKY